MNGAQVSRAQWCAATLLLVATAGCVTATPPKTPNQREVERRSAVTQPESGLRPTTEPPPAIKR